MDSVCVSHEDSCAGATVRRWFLGFGFGRERERGRGRLYRGTWGMADGVGDAM
jgi:hypothetical protein